MKRSLMFTVIWWLLASALILIGLWHLNLAIFHVWAADLSLSGSQQISDWHQKWALVFLGISLTVFFGAGVILWRLLFRKHSNDIRPLIDRANWLQRYIGIESIAPILRRSLSN